MNPNRIARLWLVLHLPAAMLVFQLALDWIDPAQTDKWLELPALALVGLAAGLLLDNRLPGLRPERLAPGRPRVFILRVVLATVLLLWLVLSAAWALIYVAEFLLGFGIQDTIRMLLLMPLVVGFYLPVMLAIGIPAGFVNAWLLRLMSPEEAANVSVQSN